VFWFAGQALSLVRIKDMTVQVRKSKEQKGKIPSWQGGRMSLTSELSFALRQKIETHDLPVDEEVKTLKPLFELQQERSHIPANDELLIELFESQEGFHLFVFPFEGRMVNEGMAMLLAYRLGQIKPASFSIAMNDYGFELLSDQFVNLEAFTTDSNLFTTQHLLDDIHRSVNATEMARRKFREIASISGLIFQGFPGKQIKSRQLQASSSLLFDVIHQYEKENLFVRQAFQEVLDYQLEEIRLRTALDRITTQKIIIKTIDKPSPFSFPLLVDRLREQLSSEKLADRVAKMIKAYSDGN
jgi:ATP-dependent Lhr-like helicase